MADRKDREESLPELSWEPLDRSSASFRTYRLEEPTPGRLEFRPTRGYRMFGLLFGVLGLAWFVGLLWVAATTERWYLGLFALFAMAFGAVGVLMWYGQNTPRVIDRRIGLYWHANSPHGRDLPPEKEGKDWVALERVAAVQFLEKRGTGQQRRGDPNWELNLVLADGGRVHVMGHGHREGLREEAGRIADLLKVPLLER